MNKQAVDFVAGILAQTAVEKRAWLPLVMPAAALAGGIGGDIATGSQVGEEKRTLRKRKIRNALLGMGIGAAGAGAAYGAKDLIGQLSQEANTLPDLKVVEQKAREIAKQKAKEPAAAPTPGSADDWISSMNRRIGGKEAPEWDWARPGLAAAESAGVVGGGAMGGSLLGHLPFWLRNNRNAARELIGSAEHPGKLSEDPGMLKTLAERYGHKGGQRPADPGIKLTPGERQLLKFGPRSRIPTSLEPAQQALLNLSRQGITQPASAGDFGHYFDEARQTLGGRTGIEASDIVDAAKAMQQHAGKQESDFVRALQQELGRLTKPGGGRAGDVDAFTSGERGGMLNYLRGIIDNSRVGANIPGHGAKAQTSRILSRNGMARLTGAPTLLAGAGAGVANSLGYDPATGAAVGAAAGVPISAALLAGKDGRSQAWHALTGRSDRAANAIRTAAGQAGLRDPSKVFSLAGRMATTGKYALPAALIAALVGGGSSLIDQLRERAAAVAK